MSWDMTEHLDDILTTTRTHVRILGRQTDHPHPTNPHLWTKTQLWITREPRHTKSQTGMPENITRPGSYVCRTASSRDRFGPKYREADCPASR